MNSEEEINWLELSQELLDTMRDLRSKQGSGLERNISGQRVLLHVLSHVGPQNSAKLCEFMHISSARMAKMLAQLEASELIVRIADPQDARAKIIQLTAKGELEAKAGMKEFMQRFSRMLQFLGKDDATELVRICKRCLEFEDED